MSDHWELFPCQIGDHQAFIAYDHGLRNDIDGIAPTSLLKIKATVKTPNDHDLPDKQEFAALNELETGLTASIEQAGGVFVGRVTVASLRIFYFYVDVSDAGARALVDQHAASSGYELRFTLREDSGREGYWQDLYPSKQDWQLARDLQLIDSLENHGDPLTAPRRLDHWAYFATPTAMSAFASWLPNAGFQVDSAKELDAEDVVDAAHKCRVMFFHELVPTFANVSTVTLKLMEKAGELDGDYDGWECAVMAAANA